MTFQPVLPLVVLGVFAAILLALRLLTLRSSTLPRWGVATCALLLIVVAAARPGFGAPAAPATAAGAGENVFVVVDRSAQSAVADYGDQQRMSGIRTDVEALIAAHPSARFALIGFAARPAIDWPLSNDTWSLSPVVEALTPYDDAGAAADQVNAGASATVLRYQLISARAQYPGSRNLVYYFGSGAPGSRAPQTAFDADRIDGGSVFGYDQGPGETTLRAIAEQLGVGYERRAPGRPLPTANATQIDALPIAGRTEITWVPALAAAALLLVEIFLSVRDVRRARGAGRAVPS